jgi:glycosyltransferase involved in cell wall biosynthesis
MRQRNHHVLIIGSDATRSGAPMLLLRLLRWLKANTPWTFSIVLNEGGAMADDFAQVCPVIFVNRFSRPINLLLKLTERIPFLSKKIMAFRNVLLRKAILKTQPDLVMLNTLATTEMMRLCLPQIHAPILAYVHELGLPSEPEGQYLLPLSTHVFTCSNLVRDLLTKKLGVPGDKVTAMHGSAPPKNEIDEAVQHREEYARDLRKRIGVPSNALLAGGLGICGWRKGTDLMIQVARHIKEEDPASPLHFVWAGDNARAKFEAEYDAEKLGLADRVHILPATENPLRYLAALDIFTLLSREEPWGLVALEAAALGIPIVSFAGGGIAEFIEQDAGILVPYLDTAACAAAVLSLVRDPALRRQLGECAREKVYKRHEEVATLTRIRARMTSMMEGAGIPAEENTPLNGHQSLRNEPVASKS